MKAELYNLEAMTVLRWGARILALLVFLFWGAFFVEHLSEWFIKPFPNVPPPKVWVGQVLHFLILLGLLLALKWPVAGAVTVVIGSVAFFSRTAGPNAPLFIGLTCLPALLLLLCWWLGQSGEVASVRAQVPK